MFDKIVK